jgi:hypothetical protein
MPNSGVNDQKHRDSGAQFQGLSEKDSIDGLLQLHSTFCSSVGTLLRDLVHFRINISSICSFCVGGDKVHFPCKSRENYSNDSNIKQLYQLGTNFVTFLEKLSAMFEGLRSRLSLYHRQIERIRESPYRVDGKHLDKALSYIYMDVIEFCQISAYVFFQKRTL